MTLFYGVVFDRINNREGHAVEVGSEYTAEWIVRNKLSTRSAWRTQYAFDEEGLKFIRARAKENRGMSSQFTGNVYVTEPIIDFDGQLEKVTKGKRRLYTNKKLKSGGK